MFNTYLPCMYQNLQEKLLPFHTGAELSISTYEIKVFKTGGIRYTSASAASTRDETFERLKDEY